MDRYDPDSESLCSETILYADRTADLMDRISTYEEFVPKTASALARFVKENASGGLKPLSPVGGRTALRQGYPLPAETILVSTSELTHIVDYPAADMTITVEAGFRVKELQDVLANQGQRLPIDIPQAHRATIGGAIATNTSGLGRFGHGTIRDYLIGISAVDGLGRLFSAGGRVVKNVAGYDLCKVLVGSLGTLGMITQVTLKLRPMTECRRFLWSVFEDASNIEPVLEHLNLSATRPVAIEVLNATAVRNILAEARIDVPAGQFVLAVAYEGTERECEWQCTTWQKEFHSSVQCDALLINPESAGPLWEAMTEHPAASDDPLTFQANVPPSRAVEFVVKADQADIAVQCHAGNGVIIGHLPDKCTTGTQAAEMLAPLKGFAESNGGSLVILNCDDEWKTSLRLFGSPRADWTLMQRIKHAFDPHGVLSPHRLWSDGSTPSS